MVQVESSSMSTAQNVSGDTVDTGMKSMMASTKRKLIATHVEIVVAKKRRREKRGECEAEEVSWKTTTEPVANGHGGEPPIAKENVEGDLAGKVEEKDHLRQRAVSRGRPRKDVLGMVECLGEERLQEERKTVDRSRGAKRAAKKLLASASAPKASDLLHPQAAKPKSTHIKFGDDEPGSMPPMKSPSERPNGVEHVQHQLSDDDDEGPDAEPSRTVHTKESVQGRHLASFINKEKEAALQKRRLRERRLKKQAKLETEKRPGLVTAEHRDTTTTSRQADGVEDTAHLPMQPLRIHDRLAIPDLLPDDILAAEPYVPPSPALALPKRHIRFPSEAKPPKDLVRGGVRVRVLRETNPALPPKPNKDTTSVRESWLRGRVGRKGVPVFERRKMGGGGFARSSIA
ncbi:MAG: hypothetical protein M1826_005099 [Phylliscum demangeonii]|nr:MAG: hypothetical protein M1826_005099 [Phylliscum demangeonii]